MKKTAALILALVIASSAYSAPVEIKFATIAPDGSTWMNIVREFAESAEEQTNNAVKFRFYAGGVSGDEKDVLRKMRNGQLHAAGFTSQGLGEVVPEVRLINIPLVFQNYGEVDYVMSKMAPYFEKEFDKKGYAVLGWPEVGFAYVFSTKKIDSLESMKQVKMWVWGDDVLGNTLFKNLGISPIALSLVDVMQSLQTGLIEGVYGSPLSALALQWNTRVKFVLDLKVADVPGGVLISKSQWRKISPENQKIIMKEASKAMKKLTEASRRENDEALQIMLNQGMIMSKADGESDREAFQNASEATAKDLVGKFYTKAQLDEVMSYLKEYRASKKK